MGEVLCARYRGLQPACATASRVLLHRGAPRAGDAGGGSPPRTAPAVSPHRAAAHRAGVDSLQKQRAGGVPRRQLRRDPATLAPEGFAFTRRESCVRAELSRLGPEEPSGRNRGGDGPVLLGSLERRALQTRIGI